MKKVHQYAVSINDSIIVINAKSFNEAEMMAKTAVSGEATCIIRGIKALPEKKNPLGVRSCKHGMPAHLGCMQCISEAMGAFKK